MQPSNQATKQPILAVLASLAIILGVAGVVPSSAVAATQCGWAVTNHKGSTFAVTSATLRLQTDWCWGNGSIVGTPVPNHTASATLYGSAGGWRVGPSYIANGGKLGSNYKTGAKTDWTLQACVPYVGCHLASSGTAYAYHTVTPAGQVYKAQGGWNA